MSQPLSIIIPVFNEGANFPSLWDTVTSRIQSEFTAYVVYDFDEDDTLPIVHRIVSDGETRIRLVKNTAGKGVVGAIKTGFNQIDHGPILVAMADLSDDLGQVDAMLALYRQGYHIVVGSRYMPGGGILGGPWFKKLLSRLAGISLHHLRGLPTHDATNAFKIYDRAMLNSIAIESTGGFEINLEITVKAFLSGYRIAEVPALWRDRINGESRFRLWQWLPKYLRWYLLAFRRPTRPKDFPEVALHDDSKHADKGWNNAADD